MHLVDVANSNEVNDLVDLGGRSGADFLALPSPSGFLGRMLVAMMKNNTMTKT